LPLAAWAPRPGFRVAALLAPLLVGLFGPPAPGARFALFPLVAAPAARALLVLLLLALPSTRFPWRPLAAAPVVPAAASA
ncbi:hypothetical protein C3R44_24255, partial [Mycobacterium tuberculosis]